MDHEDIHFLLFKNDKAEWFAAPPGLQTLLTHPVGRGRTAREAVGNLVAHPEFIQRASMGEWTPEPRFEDFVEITAPAWAISTESVPAEDFDESTPSDEQDWYRHGSADHGPVLDRQG
jgi:hypothetical protein